jgi:hypothetical protein
MLMRPAPIDRLRATALLAITFGIAACGAPIPSGRFAAFADATRTIANDSVATYGHVVDLERTYMLYNPNGDKLNEASFAPRILDDSGRPLTFNFEPQLAFRSAALDVLADYADALHAFATKDYQQDLDAATQSLGASVGRLAASAGGVSAAQAGGVLATVINGLGRAEIERLRRSTLRDAMDKAQPGVDTLAGLIAGDNTEIMIAVRTLRKGILRRANSLRPATGITRISFDGAIQGVIVESEDTLTQLDAMNAAVAKIPGAHADIRHSLDDSAITMEQLRALIAEAKRLNKFYRSTVSNDERK